MPKSVDVRLGQAHFPHSCVVCLAPASGSYELSKILTYGRKSYTVKLPVPMCRLHAEAAAHKGTAERLTEYLAIIAGAGAGLAALVLLLLLWDKSSDSSLLVKLFAGGVVGFGAFIMVWAVIATGLAPLFAEPESKEARTAVRITNYWPPDQMVRLEFRQESLAEQVGRQL